MFELPAVFKSPAADFVLVVGFAHPAELLYVVPQRVAVFTRQVIVVEDVLNRANRVVQLAFIKFARSPLLGEVAKFRTRMIQPVLIAIGELPDPVTMVQ